MFSNLFAAFFLFTYFLLRDNRFIMLCWFLLYINMNQSQVYICPLLLQLFKMQPTLSTLAFLLYRGQWLNDKKSSFVDTLQICCTMLWTPQINQINLSKWHHISEIQTSQRPGVTSALPKDIKRIAGHISIFIVKSHDKARVSNMSTTKEVCIRRYRCDSLM